MKVLGWDACVWCTHMWLVPVWVPDEEILTAHELLDNQEDNPGLSLLRVPV